MTARWILIDTHILLWWLGGDTRLSATAKRAILEAESVYISTVVHQELAILASIGKLPLPLEEIEKQLGVSDFQPFGYDIVAAKVYRDLPDIHRDPFDRALISQAIAYKMPLVTADSLIKKYVKKTALTIIAGS